MILKEVEELKSCSFTDFLFLNLKHEAFMFWCHSK